MAYTSVTQIPQVVNDAVSDLLGKTKATKLVSNGIVSLGKALEDMDLLEGWFGALAKRIVETRYMIRSYEPSTRSILRNAHEFGAFIQRVYYTDIPEATENPTWQIPNSGTYAQASPYDVEGSVGVTALIYGGKGTWTLELIRPLVQIKEAFDSASAMDAFISGLYVYVDNKIKQQEEAVTNLACSTAMANAVKNKLARNLLNEFNARHDNDILTVEQAMESADFFKYASKEIARIIENMGKMVTVFNAKGYETFTSRDNMVVEMLSEFAKASDVYLQADTFHKELVALPKFESVPYWQGCGTKNFAFEDCSAINVQNAELAKSVGDSDTVNMNGIIAFLHDIEYVSAMFDHKKAWEMVNPRSDVVIHGEKAEKGYAVDEFMNAFVLYVENAGTITVSGDAGATLKYNHAYSDIPNSITVTSGTPTATGVTFTRVGSTNEYTFTPATNADITITVG